MHAEKDYNRDFNKLLTAFNKNYKEARVLKGNNAIRKDDVPLIREVIEFMENVFPNHILLLYGEESTRIYISEQVRDVLGYTADDILQMSDAGMLACIHPDDFESVARALKNMNAGTVEYRYEINFRFKFYGTDNYVHLSYEPTKFFFQGYFVTCILIKDITKEMPFRRVVVKVKKLVGKRFVQVNEIVPDTEQTLITHREQEIIDLIKKGLRSSEIAEVLSISKNTVRNHRNRLFKKLNVKSTVDLLSLKN